ncbi:MAG TPA: hypothetical protein PKE16_18550 [Hyphomicrobium sp.]|nr:hypothetical protein [Hyphomicrobium sp.]
MRTSACTPRLPLAGIIVALLAGSVALPDQASAKHKKAQASADSDPCAEPTAFVRAQIAKIRAIQAEQGAKANNTVFGLFSSQSHVDPDSYAKIDDLRRDADTVNTMLRTGGCTPLDIDEELKKTPPPHAQQTPTQKRHRKD